MGQTIHYVLESVPKREQAHGSLCIACEGFVCKKMRTEMDSGFVYDSYFFFVAGLNERL